MTSRRRFLMLGAAVASGTAGGSLAAGSPANEARTLEAVRWLKANTRDPIVIVIHPTRNGRVAPHELRGLRDTGIVIGMEGAPGAQYPDPLDAGVPQLLAHVAESFEPPRWWPGHVVVFQHTFRNIRAPFYARVRGTDGNRHTPAESSRSRTSSASPTRTRTCGATPTPSSSTCRRALSRVHLVL